MEDTRRTTELFAHVTDRLRDQLARASSSLQAETSGLQSSLRPLHDLQAWCDLLFIEAVLDGSITLLFVLDHILEESFENLAGEFKYDPEANAMRRGFFRRLGAGLGDLAKSDLSDPGAWASIADRVLLDYRDVLAQLNRHQLAQLNPSEEGQ